MEVPMAARPHDVTDLYLSPVVLALDYEIALESDLPDLTRSMREEALIRTVTHLIDRHGWEFSWDPRGLRLSHDAHTLVLGIPAVFVDYLAGSPRATAS
jgi:hypothetical protein